VPGLDHFQQCNFDQDFLGRSVRKRPSQSVNTSMMRVNASLDTRVDCSLSAAASSRKLRLISSLRRNLENEQIAKMLSNSKQPRQSFLMARSCNSRRTVSVRRQDSFSQGQNLLARPTQTLPEIRSVIPFRKTNQLIEVDSASRIPPSAPRR